MADTLKMAVIGTGGMAQGHIGKLLTMPEVELAALVDINPQALERTKTRHGEAAAAIPTFSDYKEMLAEVKTRRGGHRHPAHSAFPDGDGQP